MESISIQKILEPTLFNLRPHFDDSRNKDFASKRVSPLITLFVISAESHEQEIEGRSQPLSTCRVAGGTARGRTGSACEKALMEATALR